MAKTTKHGGASQEEQPVRITRAVLGGERPSVGSNSTASSKSESPSNDSEKVTPRKRAQTTESRSKRRGKGTDSTVDSTAGDGQRTEQQQSGRSRATGDIESEDFFE